MEKPMALTELLADPTASNWLKRAAQWAVERDPVDALNDAEWLVEWLKGRLGPEVIE